MNEIQYAHVLFFTSNHAFRAEKLLKQEHIDCKLVPVPRQFSSECGVCLRIDRASREQVARLLASARVETDSIRDS